jgi:hypothetical protein
MILRRALLGAAIVAAGLFAAAPVVFAGPDKNGGGNHGNGGGGHSKNGGGGHSKNGGGGHNKNGGDRLGGGNSGYEPGKVVCVIGHKIIHVRRVQDCLRFQEDVAEYKPRRHRKHAQKIHVKRRVVVAEPEDVYVYKRPRVRYVAEPSLAAAQQAERRARRHQVVTCDCVSEPRVHYRKKKRWARYAPDYGYDRDVVIHYGPPAIVKNGAE